MCIRDRYEDVPQEKLRSYMMGYFTMMMAICSVFTKLSDKPGIEDELAALWADHTVTRLAVHLLVVGLKLGPQSLSLIHISKNIHFAACDYAARSGARFARESGF